MADSTTPTVTEFESKHGHVLNVRLWPKTPVLYPMALVALVCGFISMWAQDNANTQHVLAILFLGALTFSLFTLTVDLSFTWGLVWVFGVVIVGLIVFIANIYTSFLQDVLPFLKGYKPLMNPHVYFTVFTVWVILMLISLIIVRFHYVKVESNEIVVVGGVLDKRRRYSTLNVRYTKEVTDIFEYYLPLVRSGRLVLRFANEEEPVVLENVMNIDYVIKRIEHITGTMQVAPEAHQHRVS